MARYSLDLRLALSAARHSLGATENESNMRSSLKGACDCITHSNNNPACGRLRMSYDACPSVLAHALSH
eukprot:6011737-Amphidinium_carterae.1